MIYVQLFLNFLMIGALSFGGGYGMISLVRETVLSHGWLTESDFLSFIAVSESTPGPLAVNMATFIGSSQGLAQAQPSGARRTDEPPRHGDARGPDHGALHAGGLHDRGRRGLRFGPVGGGVCPFVGGALRLQKGNKKSPLADRNDRSGGRAGHPVLGRLTHSGEVSVKKTECRPTGESLQGGIQLFATGQNQNLGGSGRSGHRGSSLAGSCLRRSCLRRCSFRGCGFAGSCLRGSRDRSNGRSRRLCGRRSGSGRRAAAGGHTNSQNQSSNDNSNILEFHIPKSPYDLKNSQSTPHRRDRSAK